MVVHVREVVSNAVTQSNRLFTKTRDGARAPSSWCSSGEFRIDVAMVPKSWFGLVVLCVCLEFDSCEHFSWRVVSE